jgi:hypothetical protein
LSILLLILCIAACNCIKRLSTRNRFRQNRIIGYNSNANNNSSNNSHINTSEFPYVYRNYDEQNLSLELDQSNHAFYKKNKIVDENLPTYEQAVNNYIK